jgi:hypothetical protein
MNPDYTLKKVLHRGGDRDEKSPLLTILKGTKSEDKAKKEAAKEPRKEDETKQECRGRRGLLSARHVAGEIASGVMPRILIELPPP